jgi:FKBP-type peptidyl-prolyl cis-trans isomerase 2
MPFSHHLQILLSLLLVGAGPVLAGEPVRPHDAVKINYLCRLNNGELAAATIGESKLPPAEKRSPIFVPLQNDAPLSLVAGEGPEVAEMAPQQNEFEDEVAMQIADAVVGKQVAQPFAMTVSAARARYRDNAVLKLARTRQRPREMRMALGEYEALSGSKAEVGQAFALDPDFPGKVVSVNAAEVLLRFAAPPNNLLATPFGTAVVRETETQYLVDIDTKVGALVRSGPMVGRIAAVDEQMFAVDYGHPLAGQDLECEVTVLADGKTP